MNYATTFNVTCTFLFYTYLVYAVVLNFCCGFVMMQVCILIISA